MFFGFVVLFVFGGLSLGIYFGLLVVILVDVVGNEFIGDGMGLLMFVFGIGIVVGLFLGGKIIISSLRYIFEFSFLKMDNVINLENVCSIWYV